MNYKKGNKPWLKRSLTAPFVYGQIIPLAILDLSMEIYHRISFPIYKLPYVKRSEYIRIDRHKLQYLVWYDKFNCMYCGYANGLLHYLSRIAGESERFWCGIMHEKTKNFKAPAHHKTFIKYGDEKAYQDLHHGKTRKR